MRKRDASLLYVQSQSMRSNLIFTGITEDPREKPDITEENYVISWLIN